MATQEKLKRYLIDIKFAANFFNTHFIGKEVIYQSKTQTLSLKFQPHHFLHLCGLKYQYGAKQFFKAVLENKLDLSKISVKPDGTTYLKLSLLKHIDLLISHDIQITGNAFYLHLKFDNAIKTNKLIFALTLTLDNHQELYPNSLLDLKKMNNFPSGEKVIGIKSIDLSNNHEKTYL